MAKVWNLSYRLLLFGVLVIAFQNCSSPLFSSHESGSGGNGQGYGGMIRYFHYDQANTCSELDSSGQPLANAEIDVDGQSALLVRNNCNQLNPPQVLAISQLQFTNDGTGNITYNNLLFTPQAYYVDATGSDSNSGTSVNSPFLTLAKAQGAMQASGIKTTYIRAGTYQLTSPVNLTSSDNGERWSYYLPDGPNSAIIDGGGSIDILASSGTVSGVTINGIKFQNALDIAININGNNNVVENCDIGFNHDSSEFSGWPPLLTVNGMNNKILNNYVHDSLSQGIGIYAYSPGTSLDGTVISGNLVLRTVQHVNFSGAIYTDMHDGTQTSHISITNNFVRDYGAAGVNNVHGIDIDDNTSYAAVSGNIVGPPGAGAAQQAAFIVYNGHDNHVTGNLIDLGASGTTLTVGWGGNSSSVAGMARNTFTNNVVISSYTGVQNTLAASASYEQSYGIASNYTIQNNAYYNYAGGTVNTDGSMVNDANPVLVNPQITGWNYLIAPSSPIFNSPVNFSALVGSWGPPGFVIPQTGSAPSAPH